MTTEQILFTGLLLISGVFSDDTDALEVDLIQNELPAPLSGCYGGELHTQGIHWTMKHAAVDTLGRRCFKPISETDFFSLFTKTDLDKAFANISAQVCPSWTQSKECLRRHLSNKCDSRETQDVQESNPFNHLLIMTELICEPVDGYNILQMFKDAAVDRGIGDCMSERSREHEFWYCMAKRVKDDTIPPFKEFLPWIFECGDEVMKVCANGNLEQELALVSLWNKFRKAFQVTHGSLWNHLTAPVSISDLLK
jgi:hypothetical protein